MCKVMDYLEIIKQKVLHYRNTDSSEIFCLILLYLYSENLYFIRILDIYSP